MSRPVLAILGGTGDLGGGLALRWAKAGYPIVIGSRSAANAEKAAAELKQKIAGADVRGLENGDAAAAGDIVVLTVPWANHGPMLEVMKPHCAGKIVIDVTVPLQPPKVRTVHLPPSGSAAQATQAALGEDARVVSAFQNVAADHLADLAHDIDCDVLVCGNDVEARQQVIELAEAAGMKAWHAGQLANSVVAEALTSVLIFMNNRYGIPGAGIRITGTPTK